MVDSIIAPVAQVSVVRITDPNPAFGMVGLLADSKRPLQRRLIVEQYEPAAGEPDDDGLVYALIPAPAAGPGGDVTATNKIVTDLVTRLSKHLSTPG